MLEAFELVIRGLEKVSVLVAAALVLLMLRPAEVWLGETGSEASLRRQAFLVAILGGLAIWGAFLGFGTEELQFNVRMVGIIVAGYLGGARVGIAVGMAAGIVAVIPLGEYPGYALAANVLSGWLSGMWSRQFGTGIVSAVLGAVVIQLAYHVGLGGVLAALDFQEAIRIAGRVDLHAAKIATNAIGIILFMGLLKLVRELERAREEAATSRDLARSARLEALRYQIRPHFLFNLLNTLAYLIRTSPGRARELTLDLAEFFRYTLSEGSEETTLREELEQLERYVDLERARFGDELDFSMEDLPRELGDVQVPPLLLQPLVENAIRHGSDDGSVTVRIEMERGDEELALRVVDDGPGPPPHPNTDAPEETGPEGVGLENVRERLQRFYRGDATLDLRQRDDGDGAVAECVIPLDARDSGEYGLREQARETLKKVVR